MVEWKRHYRNRSISQLATMGLPHDNFFIFVSGSYGDIFPNLALLQSLYQIKKIPIVVLLPTRWRELAGRFQQPGVRFTFIENDIILQASLMMEGRPFALVPGVVFPTLPTLHPYLAEAIITNRISDYEVKRLLLELPVGSPMNAGNISSERIKYGENILKKAGCRVGKTVVLAFNSNSTARISWDIQALIANHLISKGLDVIFNTAESFKSEVADEVNISSFPVCQIPSDMPIEFVNLAGFYIGTLHGLTMILATFKNNAKIMNLVNCTVPEIISNGIVIPSDKHTLRVEHSEEICCSNRITECTITGYNNHDLLVQLDQWVS